jgi:4'-phosphopantetheinyl transferase
MVLYGLRQNREIGVDLEHIRLVSNMEEIARRYFSPAEYCEFLAVPRERRVKAFFDCWTRKEAFVKALGDGLSYRLDRFQVTLRPDEAAEFVSIDGRPGSEAGWSLYDVAPSESYAAAVALEGPNGVFQVRKFDTPQECVEFCP